MRTRHLPEVWLARPQRTVVPAAMTLWLTDRRSLTSRILARCRRFSVRVLSQALAVPHPDERAQLGLRAGELAWVREVLLVADGEVVVYARSILPRTHLRGCWRLFRGVGGRSLGAVLFDDPRIERRPLVSSRLDRRDWRYLRALKASGRQVGGAAGSKVDGEERGGEARYNAVDRLAGGCAPQRLWARRSCFRRCGHDLMVTEVFFPAILDLTE